LYICWKKRCDVINKWKGHDLFAHKRKLTKVLCNSNTPNCCLTILEFWIADLHSFRIVWIVSFHFSSEV
jgi:hypothetical protein